MSLENIQVVMDLPRLGELTAQVADTLCRIRGLDPVDWEDDAPDSEGRQIAHAAWEHVLFMADRAQFARSVNEDITKLGTEKPTDGWWKGASPPI